MKPTVTIYTDGGCYPNPGPGGWGVVMLFNGHKKELCGHEPSTTNNRMELTAAIEALRALTCPCFVILNTDSKYLMDGFTRWLPGWIKKDWITSSKKPVENKDLWLDLMREAERHEIQWYHIPGHSGNLHNERADELATAAREMA